VGVEPDPAEWRIERGQKTARSEEKKGRLKKAKEDKGGMS